MLIKVTDDDVDDDDDDDDGDDDDYHMMGKRDGIMLQETRCDYTVITYF